MTKLVWVKPRDPDELASLLKLFPEVVHGKSEESVLVAFESARFVQKQVAYPLPLLQVEREAVVVHSHLVGHMALVVPDDHRHPGELIAGHDDGSHDVTLAQVDGLPRSQVQVKGYKGHEPHVACAHGAQLHHNTHQDQARQRKPAGRGHHFSPTPQCPSTSHKQTSEEDVRELHGRQCFSPS